MIRRTDGLLALLVALTALSWWLARRDDGEGPVTPVAKAAERGYYLRDATLEETDADGRVYLRLSTLAADQDPRSQDILLAPVRVDYYPAGTSPWLLTARRGRLPAGAHLVTLYDEVTLSGSPAARGARGHVRTSVMTLDTVASIASTTAPVRIDLGPQEVFATGMRADLVHDRLALLSNVRGRYAR